MRSLNRVVILVLLSAVMLSAQTYKIGVLAKEGYEAAVERWQPLAEYLNARIPEFRFEVVPMDFAEIHMLVENRLVDFLIVNSAIFVEMQKLYGVREILTLKYRIARNDDITRFGSVLFTLSSSDIHSIGDLYDKRVAAVDERSLGGWIIARKLLQDHGIAPSDLFSLDFLGSHQAVMDSVLTHTHDAGIVRTGKIEEMIEAGELSREQIRVITPKIDARFPLLHSTPLYPEWPLAVLKHTPVDVKQRVGRVLINMEFDDPAAERSRVAGWTVSESYDDVQRLLESLNLPPYDAPSEVTLFETIRHYWYLLSFIALLLAVAAAVLSYVVRLNRTLRLKEAETIKNEKRYRETFEQAAVGMAYTDSSGRFLKLNTTFSRLTGYSVAELGSMSMADFMRSGTLKEELRQFEYLRSKVQSAFAMQKEYLRKGGDTIWVMQTVSAVLGDAGEIESFFIVIDDISEMKKLERKIAIQEKQKDLILQTSGDGILGLDAQGRHTFVNPSAARMLGYGPEEMIGRESHALWHHTREDGSAYPEEQCPITAVLRDGLAQRGVEELFWTREGEKLYVEFTSTPIYEEGQITGAVVVFRPQKGEKERP